MNLLNFFKKPDSQKKYQILFRINSIQMELRELIPEEVRAGKKPEFITSRYGYFEIMRLLGEKKGLVRELKKHLKRSEYKEYMEMLKEY